MDKEESQSVTEIFKRFEKTIDEKNAKIKELEADKESIEKDRLAIATKYNNQMIENQRLREQYNDLIMSVECKYNDETRHETAKRYIVQREQEDLSRHKASGRATQKALEE